MAAVKCIIRYGRHRIGNDHLVGEGKDKCSFSYHFDAVGDCVSLALKLIIHHWKIEEEIVVVKRFIHFGTIIESLIADILQRLRYVDGRQFPAVFESIAADSHQILTPIHFLQQAAAVERDGLQI